MAGTGRRQRTKRAAGRKRVANFTAAVRYRDGRSELVRVKNADDLDDARRLVMDSLFDVHVLVLTESRHGDED